MSVRAVFGVVSLLVVLAVVAFVAKSQLHTVAAAQTGTASAPAATVTSEPRGIEEKARDDVARALQDGAKRTEDADR